MKVKEFVLDKKRDFDTSISLMGLIPILVFVYLLVVKVSTFKILIGEVGYIVLATIMVFMMGIMVGRKMFISLIDELLEKHRLAAIAETTLTLGHEINNPLLTIRGNLELLENDAHDIQIPDRIKGRLDIIKGNVERIREATDKLSSLRNPVSDTISSDVRMIDLSKSV